MAEIIYPLGTPCQINEPGHIGTDEDVGLSFKGPVQPNPRGVGQAEPQVIIAGFYNFDCAEPYRLKLEITMIQARELGKWLTRRGREAKRQELARRALHWLKLNR
jgi:hypothetical protein